MVNFFPAAKTFFSRFSLSLLLSLQFNSAINLVQAATPETAPPELKEIISILETAANNQDATEISELISQEFTNSDGLNAQALVESLKKTWEKYPNLRYTTKLLSWSQTDNDLVAETITEITGVKASPERVVRLESTIKSRQYFRNNQLVRQDILEETTKVTSGDNPPQIKVLSPKTVKVGEKFNFDVIVTQPLNDDLLLGTAIEEPISRQLYLEPSTLELERLSAGGIYKIITAPLSPDKRWISAVIVGGEGITLITQRVIVEQ